MTCIVKDRVCHILRGLSVVALSLFLFACASTLRSQNFHVVKSGETLYKISQKYGYGHKEVARWNRIRSPYIIQAGQLIRIRPPTPVITAQGSKRKVAPVVDNRKPAKPRAAAQSRSVRPWSSAQTKPKVNSRKPVPNPGNTGTTTKFGWPLKGNVVSGFSGSVRGNQGIDIAGKPGQPVHATAAGKVVYSGQGLRQLGRLVIIKHDARFLSAYGHNSQLLVKEGDNVSFGQKIAIVGKNKTGQYVLHFEIRRDGSPVNPKLYLK